MVDCFSMHLNISSQNTTLKQQILKKLENRLIQEKLIEHSLSPSDKIFSILNPDDKEFWMKLSTELGLQIPEPFRGTNTLFEKLFSTVWRPKYNWKNISTEQFIAAICAANYKKLINPENITSTYEVLIAITAITRENLGVDLYEVEPHKRFINDFGID
jgi:hypothetical protein